MCRRYGPCTNYTRKNFVPSTTTKDLREGNEENTEVLPEGKAIVENP
jgi:hypothetical protein